MKRSSAAAARCGRALVLVLLLPLLGCRPATADRPGAAARQLSGSIVLAVGVNNDDRIDGALLEDLNRQIRGLTTSFRTLHPRVHLEVQPFPEERLAAELARRSRDGLAPDLLLVNGITALGLAQRGLIRSVRLPRSALDQVNSGALERARRRDGRLIGVPVLLSPQLACFDRRRLPQPPTTLEALQAPRPDGGLLRVGLPIDVVNLAWTFRPLGALASISELTRGQPATAEDRQRLRDWLEWIGQMHLQPGVRFHADQNELRDELANGQLDWIPCRATHLRRLQRRLGSHLGVSVLPSGPGGAASPINRERLLAFGINSTANQQQVAEALALFTINPLMQRVLVQRDPQLLPVSRRVESESDHPELLATLVEARDQGQAIDAAMRRILNSDAGVTGRFRQLLIRFLFGELDTAATVEELVAVLSLRAGR